MGPEPPPSNPHSEHRRAVRPTVSALPPSSFPPPQSLPRGASPSRERCSPPRSATRSPRRRRWIPKTLSPAFPASAKNESIGAWVNNEELRNHFYVLKIDLFALTWGLTLGGGSVSLSVFRTHIIPEATINARPFMNVNTSKDYGATYLQ